MAFDAIFQPLKFRNLTLKNRTDSNRCLVNAVENPLGCYEESRFPSRDAMVAQIMSVFNPPPFV